MLESLAMKFRNLTGQRFGYLTVLSKSSSKIVKRHTITLWLCLCDCGSKKEVRATNLVHGRTRTCFGATCPFAHAIRAKGVPMGESAKVQVLRMYTLRAKRKCQTFSLSKQRFYELISADCFYCGAKPSNVSKREVRSGTFVYNGIDRIKSGEGYVEGNVRSCCWICNRMKSNLSESEFLERIARIANRLENAIERD